MVYDESWNNWLDEVDDFYEYDPRMDELSGPSPYNCYDLDDLWFRMEQNYFDAIKVENDWRMFGVPYMNMSGHRMARRCRVKGGVHKGYVRNKNIDPEEFWI